MSNGDPEAVSATHPVWLREGDGSDQVGDGYLGALEGRSTAQPR
jgi:hypothetical protein